MFHRQHLSYFLKICHLTAWFVTHIGHLDYTGLLTYTDVLSGEFYLNIEYQNATVINITVNSIRKSFIKIVKFPCSWWPVRFPALWFRPGGWIVQFITVTMLAFLFVSFGKKFFYRPRSARISEFNLQLTQWTCFSSRQVLSIPMQQECVCLLISYSSLYPELMLSGWDSLSIRFFLFLYQGHL